MLNNWNIVIIGVLTAQTLTIGAASVAAPLLLKLWLKPTSEEILVIIHLSIQSGFWRRVVAISNRKRDQLGFRVEE